MKEVSKPATDANPPLYITRQLGVWRVLITQSVVTKRWKESFSAIPLLRNFFADIYHLSPELFGLVVLIKLWSSIEPSLILFASSRLLMMIEKTMTTRQIDSWAILHATTAHLCCMTFSYTMDWWADNLRPRLEQRVNHHFQALMLQANLTKDLPTSQERSSKSSVSSAHAWRSFVEISDLFFEVLSTAGQLGLIFQMSRLEYGGPFFGVLCVLKPIMNIFLHQYLWSEAYIVHASNNDYTRLQALNALIGDQYRKDIISSNVAGYIIEEYEKARKALGDISSDWAEYQFSRRNHPTWDIVSGLVGDLPMIYFAANAVINPSKFSISSIAILQQTSNSLRWTFHRIIHDAKEIPRHLDRIKNIYDTLKVNNQIIGGILPYPDGESKGDGMSLEVRDVSFNYPGSKATRSALSNVSFSVKSGQLVVIVGSNGSGKSTIVKILNNLYNPNSGEILVDGKPVNSYRINDLRQATADLSQDHTIYPLSLRENIGLGHAPYVLNADLITASAKLGGAFDFVSKLQDGFDTTLQPVQTAYMGLVNEGDGHPLKELYDKLEKQVEISGGEKQRLVASRTFMRLNSPQIRCVTVDEPSSALDSQGELELFERLREAKAGRTMIFVTHRFGHLTKHADSIICMKEGTVAEIGTHNELMEKGGEYAKLYKVQAEAFLP